MKTESLSASPTDETKELPSPRQMQELLAAAARRVGAETTSSVQPGNFDVNTADGNGSKTIKAKNINLSHWRTLEANNPWNGHEVPNRSERSHNQPSQASNDTRAAKIKERSDRVKEVAKRTSAVSQPSAKIVDDDPLTAYFRAMNVGRSYNQAITDSALTVLQRPVSERTEADLAAIEAYKKLRQVNEASVSESIPRNEPEARQRLGGIFAKSAAGLSILRQRINDRYLRAGVAAETYLLTRDELDRERGRAMAVGAVAVLAAVWLTYRHGHYFGLKILPNPEHLPPSGGPNLGGGSHGPHGGGLVNHLGGKMHVERGSGIIREIQERAAAHGKHVSDQHATEIYQRLHGKYGNHIMHHVGDNYAQSTYSGPHGDVRLSQPGTYRWNPQAQKSVDNWLDIIPKKKKKLLG